MSRVDVLRSQFRTGFKHGVMSRPDRWRHPEMSTAEFNAIWDEERDLFLSSLTKVPPSFEGGSEGK